jgi:hypothetical protein
MKITEQKKKQNYYEKMQEASKKRYDYDFVDYDKLKNTKKEDEEYWMRGRHNRGKNKKARLEHKEEVKAEEKGAAMAFGLMAFLAGVVALFLYCCRGKADASGGYRGVELRI